jgi:BirA family biotin operon repressor/biotin-[acetyl-CoA-carboxylase] ligase
MDRAALEKALSGTIFAGRLHHFTSIGSTNTRALEQARLGAPHGCYYLADEQTAGRGRSNHHWLSTPGDGLYLSILLRLPLLPSQLVWMPLLTGLVAHSAIAAVTRLQPDIRWPNDLLLNQKKVGGILVEALAEQDNLRPVILGIGINLHQSSFPPDLATPATSLDLETGTRISRQHLLVALLQSLHRELLPLETEPDRSAALGSIPVRMAAVSSWIRDRHVAVHGPHACTGITQGLDQNGYLRLLTATGPVTITTGGLRAIDESNQ